MSSTAIDAPAADRFLSGPWPRFLGRRLLRLVVSLWVLVTFSFLIVHLVPGDPVRAALGSRASAASVAEWNAKLGLDDPLTTQYADYVSGLFHGRLGESLQLRLPVDQVISERLPNTLELVALAFLLCVLVAVPLGALLAIRTQNGRHRGSELAFTVAAVVLTTIPDFCLAVGLVALLAVSLELLPVAGDSGASSLVIPVVALAVGPAAALARIVRVEMLGVLGQDYVRTARAKRLPPRRVHLRHALPNALTATLTVGGLILTSLIAGTVLVENVIAWPGLGPTLVRSIIAKDYPMVQGIVLAYGTLVLLVNLLVDVALALVDPRSTVREA